MTRAKICLWFENRDAADAARFYAETFPSSAVDAPPPSAEGPPGGGSGGGLTVNFTVLGIPCMGLNGGPAGWKHNESFSFSVETADQEETDRYWNAIVGNGGEGSRCGWCRDRWGISWQIIPRALSEGVMAPDPAVARRVMEAMMAMGKIDVAAIEAARAG